MSLREVTGAASIMAVSPVCDERRFAWLLAWSATSNQPNTQHCQKGNRACTMDT